MTSRVRLEDASDIDATYAVVRSAFDSKVEAELVNALRRAAEPYLSLVAEVEGSVVGHVFFSPVTVEPQDLAPPACQLAPLAVLPEFQGRGIGGELIHVGLSRCAQIGWSAVFLVGSPLYYSRFGFELAAPRGFSYPGPYDPVLQVIELAHGSLAGSRGRIRLHRAFAEVGAE